MEVDARKARAALKELKRIDSRLLRALRPGKRSDGSEAPPAIKLLNVRWLRQCHSLRVERRQDLEEISAAKESAVMPFLSPAQATMALQAGDRRVGYLSYGWRTAEHPDPDGQILAAVLRLLASDLGARLEGIFWDFCSVPQAPRSEIHSECFKDALTVMTNGYASPVGVMVLRHKSIPLRPTEIDEVKYNARPYDHRGWCVMESAAAFSSDSEWSRNLKNVASGRELPPNIVEIDGDHPVAAEDEAGNSSSLHHDKVEAIRAATFTSKGDHDIVVRQYQEYSSLLLAVMSGVAEIFGVKVHTSYTGECNRKGQPHGFGVMIFRESTIYRGQFCAGKRQGYGQYDFSFGDRYVGQLRKSRMHGRGVKTHGDTGIICVAEYRDDLLAGLGTLYFPDGCVQLCQWDGVGYCESGQVGASVRWSPDRSKAWLLHNGWPRWKANAGDQQGGQEITVKQAQCIEADMRHVAALANGPFRSRLLALGGQQWARKMLGKGRERGTAIVPHTTV